MIQQILSAFIVLFAIIDMLGSLPIIISLREKGAVIEPTKTTLVALALLIGFMFVGEGILRLFQVDINSFAVAGGFVLFIIGIEMVFGIEIMKSNNAQGSSSIVPVAFPLLAGPGTFTALLALRAEYSTEVIIIALLLNMVWVWLLLRSTEKIAKFLGPSGLYVLKKFFGIIVVAIAIKLFVTNLSALI